MQSARSDASISPCPHISSAASLKAVKKPSPTWLLPRLPGTTTKSSPLTANSRALSRRKWSKSFSNCRLKASSAALPAGRAQLGASFRLWQAYYQQKG